MDGAFDGFLSALVGFGFGNGRMLVIPGILGSLGEVSMDHGNSYCCLIEVIDHRVH